LNSIVIIIQKLPKSNCFGKINFNSLEKPAKGYFMNKKFKRSQTDACTTGTDAYNNAGNQLPPKTI
jgi:hypothetical protein